MEYWLDSADLEEIRIARQSLLISGHTTNQSLALKVLTREDGSLAPCGYEAYRTKLALAVYPSPISLQLTRLPPDHTLGDAFEEGFLLRHVSNNVVIKVPVFDSDQIAIEQRMGWLWLVQEFRDPVRDFPVNVTNIFSKEQAFLALAAGATYVSFFVGALEDYLRDAQKLDDAEIQKHIEGELRDILTAIRKQRHQGKLVVASVRRKEHVAMAEKLGAHIVTAPLKVYHEMLSHGASKLRFEKFRQDAIKIGAIMLTTNTP